MTTNSLSSLAILRVNIDHGKDYLDYLAPFVTQILVDHNIDPITDSAISRHLRTQFGLEIPRRTVEIVLKRISKHQAIRRHQGVYRKTGELPDPQIAHRQAQAERQIESVLYGLRQFSSKTITPIDNDERAIAAICAFLSEFDIACLRAYLRGTAIPELEKTNQTDVVLVSQYVQHVRQSSPERFDSLLVLVQGHMLANALLCPDLQHISPTYKRVVFYFDTPLLIHAFGLEGEDKEVASRELIALLKRLGGRVAAFSHSCQELKGVLQGVAASLDSPNARGLIAHEARKGGVTRSDLVLLAESIEDRLSEIGIEVENNPRYIEQFQIDETIFEQVLDDEVSYHNPRTREHDINSVRSIYVIRANRPAPSVEKAKAVFVTSNTSFAKAAWEYGQQHESTRDVSSVITSFSLANMAWLKAPMGAPSVPRSQLLAMAYAALQPSPRLLSRYMTEIDRLQTQGKITERDHQLLRSSSLAHDELVHLTLGEDAALTEETVTQTLKRVSYEITKEVKEEESKKLILERTQHAKTRSALASQQSRNEAMISNVYWRCRRRANTVASVLSVMIAVAVVIALVVVPLAGFGWYSPVLWVCTIVLVMLTALSLLFGANVKQTHQWVKRQSLTWFLTREAKAIGIDWHDWDSFAE